jgi:hypothetical protein
MKQFIFAIIILSPFTTLSQSSPDKLYGGAEVFLHYGVSFYDASSFNKSLGFYNLPGLIGNPMRAGAGGGVFLGRFYFGGEGGVQFGLRGANDLYRTDLYGGFGMVKGGYKIVTIPVLSIYPTIGLGGGGSSLKISEGPNYSQDTEDGRLSAGSSLHSGYMLVDVGINADIFLASVGEHGRLVLGVSPGYRFHPLTSEWQYTDRKLSDVEEFAPSGFYVKAKIAWMFLPDN